tara:strand:- start:187 stop:1056 length:870 start_codon:yes stop_codon:yes gene_type:complete
MTINKNNIKINEFDYQAIDSFKELIMNIHLLHDSNEGCPWHRKQTHETLIPFLSEEKDELINAVLKEDKKNIAEELGDLLLQIMLHSEISSKNKEFHLKDVINTLNKKILFRHPYIFREKKRISYEEANKIWEEQKKLEKKIYKEKINTDFPSKIKQPYPIMETQTIASELNKVGLSWNNSDEILEKILEEIKELKEAINKKNIKNIKEEFGDVFFTLINLSYFLKINHEEALNFANKKFLKRISTIEEIIGDRITKKSVNDFQKLWKLAKKKIKLKKEKDERKNRVDR